MKNLYMLSRRHFLKTLGTVAVLCSLDSSAVIRLAQAIEEASKKPPVIWLSGLGCGGCTDSFLDSSGEKATRLILDSISLRYFDSLYGFAEENSGREELFIEFTKDNDYLLVVEGAFPDEEVAADFKIGERSLTEILRELSAGASLVIASGACSSFGGIPAAGAVPAKGVLSFVDREKVINLPTCPVHNEHLLAVISNWLLKNENFELDEYNRPKLFFSVGALHNNCPRKKFYETGRFLRDWNEVEEKDYCLYMLGCRGIEASADCATRKWNEGSNWCVECGAGCQACSEPEFFVREEGFFEGRGSKATAAAAYAAAAVAGAAAYHKLKNHLNKKRIAEKKGDPSD